jgi:hypothetical protein
MCDTESVMSWGMGVKDKHIFRTPTWKVRDSDQCLAEVIGFSLKSEHYTTFDST